MGVPPLSCICLWYDRLSNQVASKIFNHFEKRNNRTKKWAKVSRSQHQGLDGTIILTLLLGASKFFTKFNTLKIKISKIAIKVRWYLWNVKQMKKIAYDMIHVLFYRLNNSPELLLSFVHGVLHLPLSASRLGRSRLAWVVSLNSCGFIHIWIRLIIKFLSLPRSKRDIFKHEWLRILI